VRRRLEAGDVKREIKAVICNKVEVKTGVERETKEKRVEEAASFCNCKADIEVASKGGNRVLFSYQW
jgi:hypothetical protein